jgi:hypothetical protein
VRRYAPIERLNARHDRSAFDCGSEQQTAWLRRFALVADQADTARTYVIHPNDEDRVAGYYALAAGSVGPDEATARLAAGAGRQRIPVVILARLGVDVRDQRRGLGQELVFDAFVQTAAIADRIGARALIIDAESPNAAAFCSRMDPAFEPSPLDPLRLVLLMKDLRRAITLAGANRSGDLEVTDG